MREPTAFAWRKLPDEDGKSGNLALFLFSGAPELAKQLMESVPDWMGEIAALFPDYPGFGFSGLDVSEEDRPQLEVLLQFQFLGEEIVSASIRPVEERPTGEFLRRFPWSQWTRAAEALWRLSEEASGWSVLSSDIHLEVGIPEARRGYPEEHWVAVADAYREAASRGSRTPTRLVADLWGINRNTAAAWVRKCRRLGLLPEARPGRAS